MKAQKNTKKISPEFDFFINTPLTQYEGKYIAIIGKKVGEKVEVSAPAGKVLYTIVEVK